MRDNFIYKQSPAMTFINETINILIGILFLMLLFKLLFFLIKYIKNGLTKIVSTIFGEVHILDKKKLKNSRVSRNTLYHEDVEVNEEKLNKPLPKEIQPNKNLVDDKYKDMSFEEIKEDMNKKF